MPSHASCSGTKPSTRSISAPANGPNDLRPMKGSRYDSRCCETRNPPRQRLRTIQNRHSNVWQLFSLLSQVRCLAKRVPGPQDGAPYATPRDACQDFPARGCFRRNVFDVKFGIRDVGRREARFRALALISSCASERQRPRRPPWKTRRSRDWEECRVRLQTGGKGARRAGSRRSGD